MARCAVTNEEATAASAVTCSCVACTAASVQHQKDIDAWFARQRADGVRELLESLGPLAPPEGK